MQHYFYPKFDNKSVWHYNTCIESLKGAAMTDTPIPKVTLEQVLRVLDEQNGNLQSMAQYFFELGHSEGEIYMADKINAVETY